MSMTALLLAISLLVQAQQPTSRVYTYVEQMPQLPGGGGQSTVVAAVQKQFHPTVLCQDGTMRYSGIKYTFIVAPSGTVHDAAILASSNCPSVDRAILAAVYALPTFKPGMQGGRPVPVRLTFSISCIKPQ